MSLTYKTIPPNTQKCNKCSTLPPWNPMVFFEKIITVTIKIGLKSQIHFKNISCTKRIIP